MRKNWTRIALGLFAVTAMATGAYAQKPSENGLVGVRLFDSAEKLIKMFGSPLEIQIVSVGGGGGGQNQNQNQNPNANPARNPALNRLPGGRLPPGLQPLDFSNAFGNEVLNLQIPRPGEPGFEEFLQQRRPGGAGGPGGLTPRPAPGQQAQGGGQTSQFTRWVYYRDDSKYGFIIDQNSRVIQIEAIGLKNSKATTKRGITFGSEFGEIILKYGAPDTYQINGQTITMRYLNRDRVVFRLSRLDPEEPHVVTGVVVAAGKS